LFLLRKAAPNGVTHVLAKIRAYAHGNALQPRPGWRGEEGGPAPGRQGLAAAASLRRTQGVLSVALALLLLLGAAVPHVTLWALSRSRGVLERLHALHLEHWRRTNSDQPPANLGLLGMDGRLFLDGLQSLDPTTGGVYLIGSSDVWHCLMPWTLPAPQRALVHNCAILGASHAEQFQFVRFLVEQENLLAGGADRTLIVLGLFFQNAVAQDEGRGPPLFRTLVEGYGLYTWTPHEGIRRAPMSAPERALRIELVRYREFRAALWRARAMLGDLRLGEAARRPPAPSREDAGAWWEKRVGQDWPRKMADGIAALDAMIAYLQARGVRVAALEYPLGSWFAGKPYAEEFHRRCVSLCRASSVPLLDLRGHLRDSEFADSTHPNCEGQTRLHPAVMSLVIEHLRRLGAAE